MEQNYVTVTLCIGATKDASQSVTRLGLPLTSIYLLEYSSEYLNEYSSTR